MTHRARAVRITQPGGPEVLQLGEIEVRDPGPGEVAIEVVAAGLNRADCMQRIGRYPAPKGVAPDVPGLEIAGRVVARGEGAERFSEGDEVMGIIAGGGMATRAILHERELVRKPPNLSLTEAAALPEVFFTAFDALFVQSDLRMGERVLIHAAGSGIGTAAIQLARVAGATSVGTSRTVSKLDACKELGLDHAIETADGKFAAAVNEAVGGVDVVLDTIGAKYLAENLAAMAPKARMVTIGLLGGVKGELDLGLLLRKRLSLRGSVLRSRPLEEKIALARRIENELGPLFGSGALRPIIDTVMPMKDIAEAHRRMEAGDTTGKIVLEW